MKKDFFDKFKFIKETDIDTIDKTRERLFSFQISQEDLNSVREEVKELNLTNEVVKKQEDIFRRFHNNTNDEKENILKKFQEYIEQLELLDINPQYFRKRKDFGKSFNQDNLDEDLHASMYIRLFEIYIPELIKKYSSNPEKLSDVLISLIKVITFDYRIISKFKTESTNLGIIQNINQIMDSIMLINKTGKLITSTNDTIKRTDDVASATEELSASITNILNTINNVSINTNKLLDDISIGQFEIENSLNDIVSLYEGFAITKANINDLVSDIRNISQIIEFIKNISEQTTLLAINASIEASRAGENGKGFSVIADEIRVLSEKTTESVENITKVIKNVEDDTRKVDKNTAELFIELKDKTDKATKSMGTLDDIIRQTREVGTFTQTINETLDEQFVSTQKVKDYLDDVMRTTNDVKKLANETGLSIYDVSRKIEELRLNTINLIPDLRHQHFLNIVKTEERLQTWWIYNALLKFHKYTLEDEIDMTESRFWKWYSKAKKNPNLSSLYAFKQLEEKHLELYHLEEKIRFMLHKDKRKEAITLLEDLKEKTNEVSNLITIIEKELDKN